MMVVKPYNKWQAVRGVMIAYLTLVLFACNTETREEKRPITRHNQKLEWIRSFPQKINVHHSPNPVKPIEDSEFKYLWEFKTTISSNNTVKIIEFGLVFQGLEGDYSEPPFDNSNFAEYYNCPNGTLIPEVEYSDSLNWCASNVKDLDKKIWYYLGVNQKGDTIAGIKEILTYYQTSGKRYDK